MTSVCDWCGCTLIDSDGDRIGEVDYLYVDEATGQPKWAGVLNSPLLGARAALVPLALAFADGEHIWVPSVTREQVRSAPNIEPDRELGEQDVARLSRHYGLPANRG